MNLEIPEMHLVNIIYASNANLKRKFKIDEIKNIINQGHINWSLINEEKCPLLNAKIDGDLSNINVWVWANGSISLKNAKSEEQAKEVLRQVILELRKYARRAFE